MAETGQGCGVKGVGNATQKSTRRSFLSYIGWGSFVTLMGSWTYPVARFFLPPAAASGRLFSLGDPRDFPEGVTYWGKPERCFVVRKGNAVGVMTAICTHLGCTVRWGGGMEAGASGDEAGRGDTHGLHGTQHEAGSSNEEDGTAAAYWCPCHGGRYNLQGKVLSGPPPKPLAWHKVSLNSNGELLVDLDGGIFVPENVPPSEEGFRVQL